jgi:hypothetical protein
VEFVDIAGNTGSTEIMIDWIETRYTAEGYVADGLIVHLDGIKNLGSSHATTTLTWKDLTVNSNDFQLFNVPNFTEKAVSFDGISQYARSVNPLQLSAYTGITVEVFYRQPRGAVKGGMLFEHTTDWNTNLGGCGEILNQSWRGLVSGSCHTNYRPVNADTTARNFLCP